MRLSKRTGSKPRKAISPVIAILLLIVIAVVLVSVVYLFGTGVIHSLIAGGVSTPMTASGQMIVPGSAGSTGILTISLRNSETQSVSSVTVACPTQFQSCITSMDYNGILVSAPAPPLPPRATAVGSSAVTAMAGDQFVSGTTYTILVTADFSSGSIVTLDAEVTATS